MGGGVRLTNSLSVCNFCLCCTSLLVYLVYLLISWLPMSFFFALTLSLSPCICVSACACAQDITCVFYPVLEFMERALAASSAKVFVHCHKGVSRSAAMVIAWLMHSRGWDFDATFAHVKQRRGITNPNLGFALQLKDWHKRRTRTWRGAWAYRVAPHCTRDLGVVAKFVDKIEAAALDPRGVFVVCTHEPGACAPATECVGGV